MGTSQKSVSGYGRLPSLIALLSLCVATVAWYAVSGSAWSVSWAIFGALGFVAAIGLDVADRRRLEAARSEQELWQQQAVRVEGKLDKMLDGLESVDAIRAAVRRIAPDVGKARRVCERRAEPRMALERPVTLVPLGASTPPWRRSGAHRAPSGARASPAEAEEGRTADQSVAAMLRDLSLRGFGLKHEGPLARGSWLLDFELDDGEHVRLVADLLWCERQDDGQYFSGGKFQRVA